MRASLLLLGLLFLTPLSGCLDEPSTETEPLASDALPAPATEPFLLDDAQTVMLDKVQVTGGVATSFDLGDNRNCLHYDTPVARSLVVEATWDPVAAPYERLELVVDGSQQFRVQGTSPLRVKVDELSRHEFFESILVIMQLERPGGVALDQPVALHVQMEHDGPEELKAQHGGCTWG